jgi:glycosyltransferase involved in cell wall biosynthesis
MLCAGILNLRVGFEAQPTYSLTRLLSWSMLEAMAAQALVVGSATAPVTEVIRDGENGLLVNFFSSEALVNAICRVLEHPDRMMEIRKQARRTIVERFDVRTICLPRQIQLIEGLGC